MEKDKEVMQGEKLSHYLDQLNEGDCPIASDQEIEELIEMATIVKQSYTQNEVPRLLIDEMVNTLATELGEEKRKRRTHWLYGGFACAAATLLLVIGTQFLLPKSADQNIAQEMSKSKDMEKMVAIADQISLPASPSSNSNMKEQAKEIPSESSKIVPPQDTTEKPADSISKVVVEMIEVAQGISVEEKPNQVAIVAKETPQQKVMAQNFAMARMKMDAPSTLDNKSQAPTEKVMLVQPDKVAQSIYVDPDHGVIRQVYMEGQSGEVIITQRIMSDHEVKARKSDVQEKDKKGSKSAAAPQAIDLKDKNHNNSLTVKKGEYLITVEGQKTTEELQKIVESLVVKNIE